MSHQPCRVTETVRGRLVRVLPPANDPRRLVRLAVGLRLADALRRAGVFRPAARRPERVVRTAPQRPVLALAQAAPARSAWVLRSTAMSAGRRSVRTDDRPTVRSAVERSLAPARDLASAPDPELEPNRRLRPVEVSGAARCRSASERPVGRRSAMAGQTHRLTRSRLQEPDWSRERDAQRPLPIELRRPWLPDAVPLEVVSSSPAAGVAARRRRHSARC